MTDEIPELNKQDLDRSLNRRQRRRLMAGDIQTGQDVADLRAFVGLTQQAFAAALGISVRTLQGWEQDRRRPDGPAPRAPSNRGAAPEDHPRKCGVGRVRR